MSDFIYCPYVLVLQAIAGISTSIILTISTKSVTTHFQKAKGFTGTVDKLIGKTGMVVQDISHAGQGIVKVDGETWTARSKVPIRVGQKVMVMNRKSTVLYVKEENK
ncbi:NfeD family protein [Bacillus sp. CDB3]|uniref:NfeD family protein n=1 Tax=Bacillus sp. CDB3 TaxID=360310 RepID=UPI00267946E3